MQHCSLTALHVVGLALWVCIADAQPAEKGTYHRLSNNAFLFQDVQYAIIRDSVWCGVQ